MVEKSRHPFRISALDGAVGLRAPDKTRSSGLRSAPLQTELLNVSCTIDGEASLMPLAALQRAQCLCVQGLQCSSSALISFLHMTSYLHSIGVSVMVLLAGEFQNFAKFETAHKPERLLYYFSSLELKTFINTCDPLCILLSSHDKRFEAVRRDARTIRWAHEVPRAYDPQASRCSTPLYGTCEASLMGLPGYVGVARSFCSFDHLEDVLCAYTPGPIRIVGVGDITNPRMNFKAFQYLSQKHSSAIFIWYGATRNKTWGNLQLCTTEVSKPLIFSTCDYLLWCAEDDPCPISVLEALYLGVHVFMFEKVISYNFPALRSERDGTPLLSVSKGAAQHCPLHAAGKNAKCAEDVAQARKYAIDFITEPAAVLVQHIQRVASVDRLTRTP